MQQQQHSQLQQVLADPSSSTCGCGCATAEKNNGYKETVLKLQKGLQSMLAFIKRKIEQAADHACGLCHRNFLQLCPVSSRGVSATQPPKLHLLGLDADSACLHTLGCGS